MTNLNLPKDPYTIKLEKELYEYLDSEANKRTYSSVDLSGKKTAPFGKVTWQELSIEPSKQELSAVLVQKLKAELEVEKRTAKEKQDKLKAEISKIRDKAEKQIAEANDAVEQLSQKPAAIGIVIHVAYPSYADEEMVVGSYVRLHKGVYAGGFGKVVDVLPNNKVRVEVLDRYTNSLEVVEYYYAPQTNVLLFDEDDIALPAYNHEFKLGSKVLVDVSGLDIPTTKQIEGFVITTPDEAGDILIKTVDDVEYEAHVGYSGYVTLAEDMSGFAYVLVRGEIRPVALPRLSDIEIGNTVVINDNGQIIAQSDVPPQFGDIYTFNKVVKGSVVELLNKDGSVVLGYNTYTGELERGDSVLMDVSNMVLLTKYKVETENNLFTEDTNVSWEDIGGCEDAKQAFMEAIEYPITHAEIYKSYGVTPPKGILLYGSPGCLAADTIVEVNRAGKSFKLPISELFVKFNGGTIKNSNNREHGWDMSITTRIRSHVDGCIVLVDLLAALDSGVKETYTVKFESGGTVRATWDHPFLTTDGWKKCTELCIGDDVVSSGNQKANSTKNKKANYKYVARLYNHPFAGKRGSKNAPYSVLKHRLVVEAHNNGLSYDQYVKQLKSGDIENLTFLDPSVFAVHHVNSDHTDNRLENLQVLTHSEHHRLEAKDYKWKQVAYKAGSDKVVSVEYYGAEQTYDLTVEGDDPNFVANGVIVHNTGKTMLAKAAVTSLKKFHGSDADTAFIYLKGPDVLSQWVGVAEEKIRNVFKQARSHKAKHGFPAIVFIDEADAILRQRGSSKSSDVDKTIVPQFLAEMDGLDDNGCILVLATNRPDSLDSAVTRNGRVDRKVKVKRPDAETAKTILELYLKNVPLQKGLTSQEVVAYTVSILYDQTLAIKAIKMKSSIEILSLGQVVNGAMLKGVVSLAKSFALQRDLKAKKPTGVRLEDFKCAVRATWEENLNVNYDEDIADIVGTRYKDVIGVEKIEGIPHAIA